MIRVYHNPDFSEFSFRETPIREHHDLTHVADVDTNDLDDAYERTNNINHAWVNNDGVTVRADTPIRSTSVGDVMFSFHDYCYYIVASFGFRTLSIDETKFLSGLIN